MDDSRIIDLYFERNESAIEETDSKYGRLLRKISFNILNSDGDSEECVNDTYMKAWGAIPPERPSFLCAFLSKITRNLSLNRYIKNRERNKMLMMDTVFEEIADCIPDTSGPTADDIELRDAINGFLSSLNVYQRQLFVKRYFYMLTVKEISLDMDMTVSNVKVTLMRLRERFKVYLEEAGINI